MIRFELIHLRRQGVLVIYVLVVVFYAGMLRVIPPDWRGFALPFLLFSEPAVIGYIFAGGVFVLEREQNIHAPILLSPGGLKRYVQTKMAAFFVYAALSGAVITLTGTIGTGSAIETGGAIETTEILRVSSMPGVLAAGLLCGLTSLGYTALGLFVAATFRDINSFLMKGVLFLLPMLAVLAIYYTVHDWPADLALTLLPGGGFFLLYRTPSLPAGGAGFSAGAGVVNLIVYAVLFRRIAERRLARRLIGDSAGE